MLCYVKELVHLTLNFFYFDRDEIQKVLFE